MTALSPNDRWQAKMYDRTLAEITLASPAYHELAKAEARFVVQTLGLKYGAKILDVPCGTGRHAAQFADYGMTVTGIDLSSACLRIARRHCLDKNVRLIRGDMAKLARYRESFDAVVNLFTSFGYFATENKNRAFLREMVRALKPGGRIAIQLIERDWLLGVFCAVDLREEQGYRVHETRNYDPQTKTIEARMVVTQLKSGRRTRYRHILRLYSKSEMVALFRECGLRRIRVYDGPTGGSFRKGKSSHPIYVAEKSQKPPRSA